MNTLEFSGEDERAFPLPEVEAWEWRILIDTIEERCEDGKLAEELSVTHDRTDYWKVFEEGKSLDDVCTYLRQSIDDHDLVMNQIEIRWKHEFGEANQHEIEEDWEAKRKEVHIEELCNTIQGLIHDVIERRKKSTINDVLATIQRWVDAKDIVLPEEHSTFASVYLETIDAVQMYDDATVQRHLLELLEMSDAEVCHRVLELLEYAGMTSTMIDRILKAVENPKTVLNLRAERAILFFLSENIKLHEEAKMRVLKLRKKFERQ